MSYLPEFLTGLLPYLVDPTGDVSIATDGLLERFLREIKEVREVEVLRLQAKREAWEREREKRGRRRASEANTVRNGVEEEHGEDEDGQLFPVRDGDGDGTPVPPRREEDEDDSPTPEEYDEEAVDSDEDSCDEEFDDDGEWAPGQGVFVDYAKIVEILVVHVSWPGTSSSVPLVLSVADPSPSADEEIVSITLHWIGEMLRFVPGVLVPFSPRLIPVVLSALAHHVPSIQQAAVDTNDHLFAVIERLPVDSPSSTFSPTSADYSPSQPSPAVFAPHDRTNTASPPPSCIPFPSSSNNATPRPGHDRHKPGSDASIGLLHHQSSVSTFPSIASTSFHPSSVDEHRPSAPIVGGGGGEFGYPPDLRDPHEPDGVRFQYGATVNELTLQFLSENEETRVAALEWLLMLHQKAPSKVRTVSALFFSHSLPHFFSLFLTLTTTSPITDRSSLATTRPNPPSAPA